VASFGIQGSWFGVVGVAILLLRFMQRQQGGPPGALFGMPCFMQRGSTQPREETKPAASSQSEATAAKAELVKVLEQKAKGQHLSLREIWGYAEQVEKGQEMSCLKPGLLPEADEPQAFELPPPEPRLRQIGASFVIPTTRIAQSRQHTISFDIPTLPAVWPLRAVLSRSSEDGPWAKIELTVDIIAAADLPPLLCCTLFDNTVLMPRIESGTGGTGTPDCTGGTGTLDCRKAGSTGGHGGGDPSLALPGFPEDWALGHSSDSGDDSGDDDISSPASNDGTDGSCGGSGGAKGRATTPWLLICNGTGSKVATIMPQKDGMYILQRQDKSEWLIRGSLDDDQAPWISVSRRGQDIGKASNLGTHRQEEHLQVDTLPDTQSPESALLLMCMLSTIVFKMHH
jgi:hypothetical protein